MTKETIVKKPQGGHMITQTVVIKRDGSGQAFDIYKVIKACNKAMQESGEDDSGCLQGHVEKLLTLHGGPKIHIEVLQDIAEQALMETGCFASAKAFILYREQRRIARLDRAGWPAPADAVMDYIHAGKYAAGIPCDGGLRLESWDQTTDRCRDMHLRKFSVYGDEVCSSYVQQNIVKVFELVREKIVMPSMRSMQFSGRAIEVNNSRMYNCSFSLVDRPEVFGQALFLLLCGCGCGFSIQQQHVAKLPPMAVVNLRSVRHFFVPDSIEGWSDAATALIEAHIKGHWIEFNYSGIRNEGVPLVTSGGKAPGHLPLKRALELVRIILTNAAGRRLRPIECHDIMCHFAEAVLAGGIRRSSLISIFSPEDEEMMMAKTPAHFQFNGKNAQREMANNSAAFLRHTIDRDQFRRCFDLAVANYGEPGFFMTNNLDYGTNPCGEIGLNPVLNVDGTKATGWSFCNLCEINMARIKTQDDAIAAARAASFIGTLQASYTSFPYLGPVTESIAKRDALLGVGMTGMYDNPELSFNPDVQRAMALQAIDTNRTVADCIGIRCAARVTTVKPSGTASLVLGMIGSGIHPHHAKRYFRRVLANRLEPVAQLFRSINPHMVVDKVKGDGTPTNDWVITFPVQSPEGVPTVKTLSALAFLRKVFTTYDNWIRPGTVRIEDSPGLTHNVSATVCVEETEWDAVFNEVWDNRYRIQAMSFYPKMSDKGSPYMPREEVTTPEDEVRWRELVSKYRPVSYSTMVVSGGLSSPALDPACGGGQCQVSL